MAQPSILRRRDVALYPLALISLGAFALALSQALRPAGQTDYAWSPSVIVNVAAAVGVGLLLFFWSVAQGRGARLLGVLWVYAAVAIGLVLALAGIAVIDRGLESVVYQAVMLVACYVGFVFPPRLSRLIVFALLALSILVQVLQPFADALEVATVLALIVVSWAVGFLPRLGHRMAARHALLASRGDVLTGALNRRGFTDEFAYASQQAAGAREPLALLMLDLNDFKQVNDRFGHAAGDELLAWVGQAVPPVLPERAAFARLGGDEFAIALPGMPLDAALGVGEAIELALAERTRLSIGVACAHNGQAGEEALMQAADRALYAAKADPSRRVQAAAMRRDTDADRPPRAAVARPELTYRRLREAGGPPDATTVGLFDGRWFLAGFGIIAAAGTPIVISNFLFAGHSFFEEVLRYLGLPWIVANVATGMYYRRLRSVDEPPRVGLYLSGFLVAGGVGAAALASGLGMTAPIMAAYVIKILFDACLAGKWRAREDLAIILFFWIVVVVCGPASSLWAAPFQLVILGAAHVLGIVSRAALETERATRLETARTDQLTGLLNRTGFGEASARALAETAAGGPPFAVLTFDLDDFKGVNDTLGHAAGDQLLRDVATLMQVSITDAIALGRLGGDEFVAIVPFSTPEHLDARVARLDAGLAEIVGGSIGAARYGEDGTTIETLLGLADARAYLVKQSRPNRHLRGGTRRAAS